MSTVYGPVPSWRFGRSLGIDVLTPPKKCTFDCIYCQLGRTKIHVPHSENVMAPWVDTATVLADLNETLTHLDLSTVDVITVSGCGEPTLSPMLGEIAKEVKDRIRPLPLAILTNASLLYLDKIRRNLAPFDLVVAKLDAGDDETLHSINRPADDNLTIPTILSSIKKLRKEFKGSLALEVMLISSTRSKVTNVEGPASRRLIEAILTVKPDFVQLQIPYRPTSEQFVKTPTPEKLEQVSHGLAKVFNEETLWIYGRHDQRGKRVSWITHKSLEQAVIDLLKRRPCRIIDVSTSLGIELFRATSLLKRLKQKNIINVTRLRDEQYYSYSRVSDFKPSET